MSLMKKILWRMGLTKKALLSGGMTDWVPLIKEIFSFHRQEMLFPPYELIQKSEDLGLYQVGERKVWFPLSFDPYNLGAAFAEIFEWKVYEKGNCIIRPGDWVVDAGACEGFFSLYALERGAKVLAFEPVPEIARALEKTLEEHIDEGRAKVFAFGLGKERGEKILFIQPSNSGGSSFKEECIKSWAREKTLDQKVNVLTVTLDEIYSSFELSINFIKADVEGFERELLLGAKETISQCKPRLSIYTYHLPDDWKQIPEIIQGFGVNNKMRFRGPFDHVYGW